MPSANKFFIRQNLFLVYTFCSFEGSPFLLKLPTLYKSIKLNIDGVNPSDPFCSLLERSLKLESAMLFLCLLLLSLVLNHNALRVPSLGGHRSYTRLSMRIRSEIEEVPSNPSSEIRNKAVSKIAAISSAVFTSVLTQLPKPSLATFLETMPEGKIVVLGAGGKTGKLIVDQMIIDNLGNFIRPVYRGSPKNFGENSNIETAQGDVTKIETLEAAIKGASAVIFAASASKNGGNAKAVDNVGVENVAKECIRLNIPKLVVISSGAITKPNSLGFKITNLFGNIMNEKLAGENALIEAYKNAKPSQSYVIIRPGGLTDGNPLGASGIELNQGDTISGEVNRSDVALAALAAATSKTLSSKSVVFEMYRRGSGGPLEGRFPTKSGYEQNGATYEEMFKGLKSGKIDIL